jgi:hypothetical protein
MSDGNGISTPWIVVIVLCVVVTGLIGYVFHVRMGGRAARSRSMHGGEYYEITGVPNATRRGPSQSTGYSPALPAPVLATRSRGY